MQSNDVITIKFPNHVSFNQQLLPMIVNDSIHPSPIFMSSYLEAKSSN